MRRILRKLTRSASRSGAGWLTLFLLLAVLVPSACFLWFMNQAAQNERLAMRQRLMDVYRGNLVEARNRLEAFQGGAVRFFETNTLPAPALFAAAIHARVADSVVCLDAHEKPVYPSMSFRLTGPETFPEAQRVESTNPAAAADLFESAATHASRSDLAARAFQGEARCLMEAGRKEAAIAVVTNFLMQPRFCQAADSQGRLIVPSAELMALEAGGPATLLKTLCAQLLDYSNAMPSPQRLFLMRQVRKFFPRAPAFPTLAAEKLAADYLERRLTNVWVVPAAHGRVLMLWRNLPDRLRTVAGPNIILLPPGKDAGNYLLTVPVGGDLLGWRLAVATGDRRVFDQAADARIASYAWIGILGLTAVSALAFITVGLIRRQAAVVRLRNDLLANVTHELKTPLASMRLLVDTLLKAQTLNEVTVREYLQLIARENLRLSRLIDNFLAFSRMERNKCTFDFRPSAPKAIVESAAAAVRERFQTAGCELVVKADAGLPLISADADAIVTVLLNLLDNAFKYSREQKKIRLCAEASGGTITFAVSDNGIGLAPREQKRIFKRFYRVDQRLAQAGSGCGLGLSIVQFIVHVHQGTVRVESAPGRGSTFFIILPTIESL